MPAPTFEFFPPDESAIAQLVDTARAFAASDAQAFSVTYGAGGNRRRNTLDTVQKIASATGLRTVPHLSCLCDTEAQLKHMVDDIVAAGCERIMVIRGDVPADGHTAGELRHALELVQLIRERAGEALVLEVACYPETHPEASSPEADLHHLLMKQEAGASVAVSQLFFGAELFLEFAERCRLAGCRMQLVPGIMPVRSLSALKRMAERCSSKVPDWFSAELEVFEDGSQEQQARGTELLIRECRKLLDAGVERIHFYTLNHLQPTLNICRGLDWHG